MNPGVSIRKYEAQDFATLKPVFFSNVPRYFDEQEWPDFEEFLKVDQLEWDCHYYVLLRNDEVIGAGGIGKNDDGTVCLCWGMVQASLHKQGLGKFLLEQRLALAETIYPGCPMVVATSQHTYAFFEKYGFETQRIVADHWAKGLHLYDMKKR